MKNLNLIKGLWDDSHEKRTPQRLRRYAVMLLMLLTLGVGQMWAETIPANTIIYVDVSNFSGSYNSGYYFSVSNNGTTTATSSNTTGAGSYKPSSDTWYTLTKISGNLYAAKVTTENTNGRVSFWSKNESSYSQVWEVNVCLGQEYDSSKRKFTISSGKTTHGDRRADCFSCTKSAISLFEAGSTLYLKPGTNWKKDGARFAACFLGQSGQTWVDCSRVGSSDYYSVTVPAGEWPYVIFCRMNGATSANNWDNKWNQTDDLAPSSGNNGVEIPDNAWSNSQSWIVVYTGISVSRTPTAAANAPTITNNQTVVKSGSSVTINAQTENTGYDWTGWTKTSGTLGNASNKSTTFTPSANSASAVANYSVHNYSITYNNMDGATNHASNPSTYTIESAAITLQAPKKTGYMFDGWYTDEELTTPVGTPAIAAGSTGNKVFYAKWTEITLTEVSASPSTGGTGVQTMTVSFKTNVPRNSGYYYRVAEFGGKDAGTTGGGFHSNGNGITSGDASTLITSGEFSTINFTTSGVYTSAIEIYTDGPLTVQKRVTFTYGAGDYYTVSFNLQGHGSDIDDQLIASGSKATEPDEPSEDGYEFGGWYKEAACTNAWSFSTETVTANKTLFAKWTANQYTITFDKEGGSGGSDNVTVYYDATLGAFVSAPTRTGYTFAGYWTGDNGTGTMLFAANGAPQASVGSYTDGSVKWIYAGNPTVYAKWTEDMSSLTTSCHYDAGNPSYSVPSKSVSSIGISTTSTITATTPSTGYTFAGWTLSDNIVVTSGDKDSDLSLTIRTNGNGAAATAQANYEEVLTQSTWILKGGSAFGGSAWSTEHALTKKTGHSTESVVYHTFEIASTNTGAYDANFNLKLVKKGASDTWFGIATDSHASEWWYSRSSGERTMSTGGGDHDNVQLRADVAGPYEVKIDYTNTSSPKITITFPTSYTLTYDIGTVAGTDGSISTSPSTASGSKVLSGNEITLTGPAAKTGYHWKGWYTNAAGTEGKITDTDRAITVTMNADKTLYACYEENTYNVSASASPATGGTVSPTSATSMGQVTGGSISASPNPGYSFTSWSIATGNGSFTSSTSTASNTFKPTEASTLTGTFSEVMRTVGVTVNNNYLGSVDVASLTNVGPVTKSAEVTATAETGASFSNWTLPSGVTAADGYSASSNPIKVNATAGSTTITANFSETMHTVTMSTADGSKGTVGASSASVGQITAVEITATPKSGYMFSKWVKTAGSGTVTYYTGPGNGQVEDASGEEKETTYICVTGDVTLQATWEADRSSGYVVHYGNSGKNADGGADASQTRPWKDGKLYRATTEASDVSYFSFTAGVGDVDKVIYFKIWDLGSNWYGYNSADGGKFSSDITNVTLNTSYGDARMCIIMPGTYRFTWNKSTKKLSVEYPNDVYYLRGGFNSWDWSHPMTEVRSGVYAATINLTEANHTYEANTSAGFKVLIAGKYYGKDGTTVTRANSTGSADISGCNTSGNNFGLTTDFIGNYTFEYTVASNTLKVIYPTAYTVTYGVGTEYSSMGSVSTSPSVTSGNYVREGSEIAFTATPNLGYKFVGWYREAACTNEVSTDNPYEPTINATTTLYAKFAYRDLYIHADFAPNGWSTPVQMTQSTVNRAIYTYEIDPLNANTTPVGAPAYDGGWHFHFVNTIEDPNAHKAYTYDGVQTPTGSGIISNSDIHKTADGNPTIQFYLTHKSKITITLTLQSVDDATKPTVNIAADRYYDIDYTAPSNGSYTIQVGSAGAVSANAEARAGTTITLANTPNTGYTFGSWTVAKSEGTVTVSNNQFTMPAEDVTVSASFTANTYKVRFERNGGTGGDNMDDQTFAYDAAQNLTECSYTKTGYNFAGWALAADAAVTYADEASVSNLTATNEGIFYLYAKWTPMSCTVEFDFDESDDGFGNKTGATTDVTATYDAAMTSVTPPTAANGYAFMGYFDAADGEGTQYYDGTGASARVWDKATESNTTLYAYYKKAEITLAFDEVVVLPEGTVGVTPTIAPTPVGNTIICWTILHSNDTPLDPQPSMTYSEGKLTFAASTYSGTYKVQAVLRTGSSCGGGTALDTETASFQVAGTHNVTVNYKCGDDVIKASTIMEDVEPLSWTEEFTAPEIFGYTFARWDAADGVTIKNGDSDPVTTSTNATIQIRATYAGSLTANYTQNQMIFFKNTLGWEDVYVNFYTESYWNNPKGSGNEGVTNRNKHMIQIGESDIYYYDYGAESITPSLYVSFTNKSRDGVTNFWGENPDIQVVYPANYADDIHTNKSSENGFKAATPMFVPLATQDPVTLNSSGSGKANYYNAGYWTTYTSGTGYRLEIYSSGGSFIKGEDFTSADDLMPMKAKLDLEGNTTYKFQLRRGGESSAGIYYGNSGTMTYTDHGQGTPWAMTNSSFSMCQITTNAAGDYMFNLSYSPNADDQYRLRIAVDYPVSSGDYRLVYSDAVQTKPLTSAIVTKENDGSDIVSFFVRPGSTPVLRIQQATVALDGTVTWKEYPIDGTPTNQITGDIASAITAGGTEVYNFNLSMNGSGAMTVASAEIYEGNFYIRTDAANSKWDNYRTDPDHVMTYSEYSITHGGYTHYYTHWVNKDDVGRKNVKFVIANDYSPNISDTLARETATGAWAHIADWMEEGGDLKRSANVRYMWDKRDNTISRAYVDGAQTAGSLFLTIISADSKVLNPSTSAVQATTTFSDKGNWMYEANVKAIPGAAIKLKSTWGDTGNAIVQYFKGAADATEELIGGSSDDPYDIRIIYDFKTNRMIAGLIPSGNISDPLAINADVMFIREHHGDIAQLTFTDDGAITDIETAFGVLQFNKWTINNKSKEEGHSPLSPLLSRYERDLFYVSFPFKVAMEEVFGFGTYGQHWIIEEYDGAARAENGFWLESAPNWKFIFNRKNKFFEPGRGYIIALDLDEMGESADIWANTDRVELYFPSYGKMDNITSSTATYNIPSHECTINRTVDAYGNPTGLPADYDRRIKDSHWNVLGVPTYVNPDAPDFANTDWTTEATETSIGPNFLYEWNKTDNSVSAVSASGYTYHAMHAYLVQYCGDVTWTSSVSVKPSSIVARRSSEEAPQNVEFRLELLQNDVAVDQTFVKLSDDEHVTTGFEFNYDLSKEFNANKANIYTLIGTEQVAGNVMPMSDQTTVVPVGVKIAADGEYTFAIPEGTEGIGVVLIDNIAGTRTNLGLMDYSVTLSAGKINDRFLLEISPIVQSPTDLENTEYRTQNTEVRKVMIDGILYIVKDGIVYDAQGHRVQ